MCGSQSHAYVLETKVVSVKVDSGNIMVVRFDDPVVTQPDSCGLNESYLNEQRITLGTDFSNAVMKLSVVAKIAKRDVRIERVRDEICSLEDRLITVIQIK